MKKTKYIVFISILISSVLYGATDSRITFNQGIEALKAGNYSAAELLFRKTLENDDEYRDRAWFYLARTIYQQEKYRPAIFEFNSFLTKCRTENLRIESRFWIGESYFNLNEHLKAIEEYNRFLEKTDDKPLAMTAHDRIATIYYKQLRYEEAVIEWDKAIQKSENREQSAAYILKISGALFNNRQYDAALEKLNPLLTSKIGSNEMAETRLLAGRIYQLQNDHRKALLMFNAIPRDLAGLFPYHDMYYFRAMSYIAQEKYSLAKSDLELFYMIAKKSQYYYDGIFELGRILLRSNKPENGIEMLAKIWEDNLNAGLSIKSGIILADYYLEKEPLQSVRYLDKYTTIDDEELKKQVQMILAKAYIKTGKYDKAELLLKSYSESFPYDESIDEILFLSARIHLEMGDIDKASEIFEKIKNEHPFSKFLNDSEYYMALVNYKKGKYANAISNLKQYLSKKDVGNVFEAHILLEELYLNIDDLKSAEKEIQFLMNKYPDYSGMDRIIYNFAMRQYAKNPASAERYFSILQSRYPASNYAVQVNFLYGSSYYENKNYARAISYYEKFLSSGTEDNRGTAFYNLIVSYYNIKKYEKVIEILKNSRIPPMDESQWKEIPLINARCLYILGRYEEVYSILKWDDIRILGDDDARMLIDSTIRTGDITTALKLIESVREKEPLYMDSMILLGDYHRDRKNYSKAQEIYSQIIGSGESDELKERARLELAVINTENGSYTISMELLDGVSAKKYQSDKESLIIINNFNTGNSKTASEMTDARMKSVTSGRFEEKILLLNLQYHFDQKNEKSFARYSSILKKYQDNENYINYLSAKLYYEKANYSKAASYYSKLTLKQNIYREEAEYFSGLIALAQNKSVVSSQKYFKSITMPDREKNEYYYKSKIELAMIYHELTNDEASIQILEEIIRDNYSMKITLQAENLLDFYKILSN